jgi:natural product precursor
MKKIRLEKKLSLNKETISKLNEDQLNNVKGGWAWSWFCKTDNCPTKTEYGCATWSHQDVTCDWSRCVCPG